MQRNGRCFRPLTGISLFLFQYFIDEELEVNLVFVPSRGFLFFYAVQKRGRFTVRVFVPSRGFLFFYDVPIEQLPGI